MEENKKPIYEWWFKDALGQTEKKLESQGEPEQKVIEFYEGRLYKKEVETPTLHNNWVPIKKINKKKK